MIAKINVSLPKDVLEELDRAAEEAHTSRSAFLVRAVIHYLEDKEEERRRQRRLEAVETIHAIAEKLGDWDAVGELLKSRNSH